MLLKVGEICQRVAHLADDPGQTTFDQDFVRPFLNQCADDMALELAALGMSYAEVVSVINPVAATTANLSAYQATGQPLESMVVPVYLEWKRVGDDDTRYIEIPQLARVLDVNAATQGNASYEWRNGVIYISPSSIATVIRVRFRAYSLDYVDPASKVTIGASNVIAYKTLELVHSPTARNNKEAAVFFAGKYREAMDNFEVLLTKLKQGIGYRIQRTSQRNRPNGRVILKA